MQEEKKKKNTTGRWFKDSISFKLITISILGLALLIPSSMVKSIIHERSGLHHQANMEVRSMWALQQTIYAPIVSIPVTEIVGTKHNAKKIKSYHHFLPESLNIVADIHPKTLQRGIYEVIVYHSELKLDGQFEMPSDFNPERYAEIHWNDAIVTIGISDLRGIQEEVLLKWDGKPKSSEPGSKIDLIYSGLTFPINDLKPSSNQIDFSINIKMQGSERLSFAPLGKETQLTMNSSWESPSFSGNFLPDSRKINSDGFEASWNILQINRNFPQHFKGASEQSNMEHSIFGVDLIKPSDAYQKSIRSIKYALMNIALTFLIFFLVEVYTKKKIHLFQYIMIGLSIVLFYVLLVSISEHVTFMKAYLIAATTIVSMIYLYSLSIFKSLKFSLLLLILSVTNYAFIYIILQMTDYALLIGALSLTTVLAFVMYGTRNLDWYHLQKQT